MGAVIRHLRNAATADGATDAHLLQRFAHHRDGPAFAALVERHGPMVLGVCRRILRDPQDADDAFQATFLVLVHKTSSITRPQSLASWLYRTALRTALRARARRDHRRNQESVLDDVPAAGTTEDLAWHELRPALDEEVSRLPRKYRDAIVSCYFQEKTYAEAAEHLGLAAGTVSSRLARARGILRKRLLHRGLTLSAGLLVTLLSRAALAAAVRGALREATTAAAVRLVTGQAPLAAAATSSVSILTRETLRTMHWTKLKLGALVVFGAVCAGAAAICYDRISGGRDGPSRAETTASRAALKDGDKNANGLAASEEHGSKAAETRSDPPPAAETKAKQKREKEEARAFDTFAFDDLNGWIPLFFLTEKPVQADLKMTDQQVKTATAAYQKHREAEQNLRGLEQPDRFAKAQKLSREALKVVRDVLDTDQQKRLWQISVQQQGVRLLNSHFSASRPIIKELGLSEEQQGEITQLIRTADKKCQEVRAGDRPHSEEVNEKVDAIEKKLEEKVLSVLTREQKTKWNETTGKPFTGPRMVGR
ncbi:RNA polymerase sigma factor [Frigoriglobus tundricola]|nr:sigma-70 family RNA polymerase sigma factor [Frigoriglobus tundricola]